MPGVGAAEQVPPRQRKGGHSRRSNLSKTAGVPRETFPSGLKPKRACIDGDKGFRDLPRKAPEAWTSRTGEPGFRRVCPKVLVRTAGPEVDTGPAKIEWK